MFLKSQENYELKVESMEEGCASDSIISRKRKAEVDYSDDCSDDELLQPESKRHAKQQDGYRILEDSERFGQKFLLDLSGLASKHLCGLQISTLDIPKSIALFLNVLEPSLGHRFGFRLHENKSNSLLAFSYFHTLCSGSSLLHKTSAFSFLSSFFRKPSMKQELEMDKRLFYPLSQLSKPCIKQYLLPILMDNDDGLKLYIHKVLDEDILLNLLILSKSFVQTLYEDAEVSPSKVYNLLFSVVRSYIGKFAMEFYVSNHFCMQSPEEYSAYNFLFVEMMIDKMKVLSFNEQHFFEIAKAGATRDIMLFMLGAYNLQKQLSMLRITTKQAAVNHFIQGVFRKAEYQNNNLPEYMKCFISEASNHINTILSVSEIDQIHESMYGIMGGILESIMFSEPYMEAKYPETSFYKKDIAEELSQYIPESLRNEYDAFVAVLSKYSDAEIALEQASNHKADLYDLSSSLSEMSTSDMHM